MKRYLKLKHLLPKAKFLQHEPHKYGDHLWYDISLQHFAQVQGLVLTELEVNQCYSYSFRADVPCLFCVLDDPRDDPYTCYGIDFYPRKLVSGDTCRKIYKNAESDSDPFTNIIFRIGKRVSDAEWGSPKWLSLFTKSGLEYCPDTDTDFYGDATNVENFPYPPGVIKDGLVNPSLVWAQEREEWKNNTVHDDYDYWLDNHGDEMSDDAIEEYLWRQDNPWW